MEKLDRQLMNVSIVPEAAKSEAVGRGYRLLFGMGKAQRVEVYSPVPQQLC
jgi:hypothetical protein